MMMIIRRRRQTSTTSTSSNTVDVRRWRGCCWWWWWWCECCDVSAPTAACSVCIRVLVQLGQPRRTVLGLRQGAVSLRPALPSEVLLGLRHPLIDATVGRTEASARPGLTGGTCVDLSSYYSSITVPWPLLCWHQVVQCSAYNMTYLKYVSSYL